MKKTKIALIVVCALAAALMLVACAKIYTVTFDPNGGSIASGEALQTVNEGEAATPPTPERQGYLFEGWEGDYTAVTGDVSVRAKWTPLYTVTFDPTGGSATDTALLKQTVKHGEDAVMPQVSREGYEFDGWSIGDLTNVTSDLAVTAKWTRLWTVQYFLSGGEIANDSLIKQVIREDQSPTTPRPTREGYDFIEWKESVDDQKATKTYTAIWERRKYTPGEINKMISAATAEITTYRPGGQEIALGSGFFIQDNGLLVTNYHVVEGAYTIKVKLGSYTYNATHVHCYNKQKDVATLWVDTNGRKVPYLDLNTTLPQVGETVYAIGSSLGLTGTFSSGIVSYSNRELEGVKFIQTTAPISSGNSGGPLVNEFGQVIGMNTATYTQGQNVNLSVTANEIKTVLGTSRNLELDDWFYSTTEIKYLPGDFVQSYQEPYTICTNGYTYKGKLGQYSNMFVTKASSKDHVMLIMVKLPNPDDLDVLKVSLVSSKMTNNVMSYPAPFSTSDKAAATMIDEEGNGWLIVSLDIPDGKYAQGYTYYGLEFYNTSRTINYEYFSWSLSPADLEKFMEYFE